MHSIAGIKPPFFPLAFPFHPGDTHCTSILEYAISCAESLSTTLTTLVQQKISHKLTTEVLHSLQINHSDSISINGL